MKFIVTSIGTRGDMEPFLALGEILKKRGHEVICLFPEQFRKLAEDSGFGFASLGSEFIDLLESKTGKQAMGGAASGFTKILAYIKLGAAFSSVNKEIIHKQFQEIEALQPDRIIHNGKAIYPIIWGVKHPKRNILVSPVPYLLHPVKDHAHIAFSGKNYGKLINQFTYWIGNTGLTATVMKSVKWLKLPFAISRSQIVDALQNSRAIYTISPTLVPKPNYWGEHIKVLGYHERNKQVNWQPDEALLNFIERNPKFLLITFGSMTNPEPAKKTQRVLQVLQKHNIAAIINTAAGGMEKPDNFASDTIHFVNQIPYDWVLPKAYGMVHHGGSGTTHMGLKNGCTTTIVPHIIDQFMWNNKMAELGVGPIGPPITKLHSASFEKGLVQVWNNSEMKTKAEQIAQYMQAEGFEEAVYEELVSEV